MSAINSKRLIILQQIHNLFDSQNYRWLTRPLIIFVASRLLLLAAGLFSAEFIQIPADVPNPHISPLPVVDVWVRWDSNWYMAIAQLGYDFHWGDQYPFAFFPAYPLMIRVVNGFFQDYAVSGLVISNLAFLAALILLYQLTFLELGDHDAAARTILYISIFPTALFFSAVYTESVYLLFSVAAFYFARKRHWTLACCMGLLCSATRLVGLSMFVVVGVEWLKANDWKLTSLTIRRFCTELGLIALIPCGLLAYMLYLQIKFGDAFAFLSAQRGWGNAAVGPWNVIWNALTNINNGEGFNLVDLTIFFGAFLMLRAVYRKLGLSYALYSLLLLLIPITATVHSMTRYVVVIFPLFMVLGVWAQNKKYEWILVLISTILMCIFMAAYTSWHFIG